MRLYIFIHYSNINTNSYNHIVCYAKNLARFKFTFPIIVLNTNSILFFIKNGCLHLSKRVFLSFSAIIPQNSILHFWSPRKYIYDYFITLGKRLKLVLHMEDNYQYLSKENSNNCISHKDIIALISAFDYVTTINKNIFYLYRLPLQKYILLRPPTVIHKISYSKNKCGILHLGTINQYNVSQVLQILKSNFLASEEFKLVGKNFYPKFFNDLKNCDDYGFVKEKELYEILSNTLISFVPYLAHEFDHYRYPSKVPDLLTAGVPTLLPDYEYYQDIFNEFPELKYDKPQKGRPIENLDELVIKARHDAYRNELSQFARDYFSNQKSFLDFVSMVGY